MKIQRQIKIQLKAYIIAFGSTVEECSGILPVERWEYIGKAFIQITTMRTATQALHQFLYIFYKT